MVVQSTAKEFLHNVHQNNAYLPEAGVKWQEPQGNGATEGKCVQCTLCLQEMNDYEWTAGLQFKCRKGDKGEHPSPCRLF